MGIEVEKKYRLTPDEWARLSVRLRECGAVADGEEFEENTLYAGGSLDLSRQVLRLRRAGNKAYFTYKERYPSVSPIKRQREDETVVEDAQALSAILDALGYKPAVIYEKRRATWRLRNTEIVLDELPFGLFAEIEGEEEAITEIENELGLNEVAAEMSSYPKLTRQHGLKRGDLIEARFKKDSAER
ncbi:MAG TPA: class IV adenylate cyclase [Pyrinomonadaceae bacterium]